MDDNETAKLIAGADRAEMERLAAMNDELRQQVKILEAKNRDLEHENAKLERQVLVEKAHLDYHDHLDYEQAAWDRFAAALMSSAATMDAIGALADEMLIVRRERRKRRIGGP